MRNAGLVSNVPPHSKSLKKRALIFQSVGGYEDGYRKPLNKPTNTAHCLSFHVVPTKTVKNITLKQSKVSKQKCSVPRKPLAFKLTGQVKCFHVRKGYGFIHSVDLDSDIFIHYSAITKNNPKKLMKSVRKGEIVQFDVVMGSKNLPEAVNVTGPNNQPVQGSWYAPDRKQNYSKGFNLQQRLQQVSCMNNSQSNSRISAVNNQSAVRNDFNKKSGAPTSGQKNSSQPPVPTLLAKPKNTSLIGKKPVNMSETDVKNSQKSQRQQFLQSLRRNE